MTRILVVDDDRPLLRALRITLTARGYDVTTAADGAGALSAATQTVPDLVIVDLGLPDMDGVTLVQGLRGWLAVPIIVLSARHTEEAKINALDAGADDYVTKPFGMGELQARIRAALRRATPADAQPVITTTAFTIDLSVKRVTAAGGDETRRPPATTQRGMGSAVRDTDQLPARPHGQPATQTRTRPHPAPIPAHRPGAGLPVRRRPRVRSRRGPPRR
jgi:two-component system KDP operon response regulator KdpE